MTGELRRRAGACGRACHRRRRKRYLTGHPRTDRLSKLNYERAPQRRECLPASNDMKGFGRLRTRWFQRLSPFCDVGTLSFCCVEYANFGNRSTGPPFGGVVVSFAIYVYGTHPSLDSPVVCARMSNLCLYRLWLVRPLIPQDVDRRCPEKMG